MKVLLLLNWGLGYEILKVFHKLPGVFIIMVVTRHNKDKANTCKWENIVYNFSKKHGYKTIDQERISFEDLKQIIDKNKIDLLVSHAYMKIIPKKVFMAPKLGSINIHASLLPKYRGPSPVYWLLKNKDKTTGLTCHFIDEGVDKGDIIFQKAINVEPDDNIDSIIERQKIIVEDLIVESMTRVQDPDFCAIKQSDDLATYAPRPIL